MEVELSSDELGNFVSRREASEFALYDVLHLFLNDNLLSLVKFKIAECAPSLASVPLCLRSEERNFV